MTASEALVAARAARCCSRFIARIQKHGERGALNNIMPYAHQDIVCCVSCGGWRVIMLFTCDILTSSLTSVLFQTFWFLKIDFIFCYKKLLHRHFYKTKSLAMVEDLLCHCFEKKIAATKDPIMPFSLVQLLV